MPFRAVVLVPDADSAGLQVRIGFFGAVEEMGTKYNVEDDNTKPRSPMVIRALCCCSTSVHWWLDTLVGLILSATFAVACGVILAPEKALPPRLSSIRSMSSF